MSRGQGWGQDAQATPDATSAAAKILEPVIGFEPMTCCSFLTRYGLSLALHVFLR
jgi:hypothetical protein